MGGASWRALSLGLGLALGGCGTVAPDLEEFPATAGGSHLLVNAITESIFCELRNAVVYLRQMDEETARLQNGKRLTTWFDGWGVLVALTLTVEERSSANVTGNWIDPLVAPSTFVLASGVGGTLGATRTDKMNYFFKVQELYALGPCDPASRPDAPPGSLLVTSDLKLKNWLTNQAVSVATGAVSVPASAGGTVKSALSHEVKFELLTNGQVSPSWRIAEAYVNPGSPMFSTSRNRIHDLILTFGPIESGTRNLQMAAANSFLASEIGQAVQRNGF